MNHKQNGVSRLLRLVWKEYKIEMLVVILAIIGSALASVKGTLFLQTLIDDYIICNLIFPARFYHLSSECTI